MDKRYQVFVSSTYADLQQERQKVIQTLMEMDCIPSGMELFPAADDEQWEFIKRVIDDCDYYILIIGGRYGSLTPEGISYTEKEYDYAISKDLKVLAFIHESPDDIPFGKSDIEPVLRDKLNAFRKRVSDNRLVKFWNSTDELPGLVALSLSKTIKIYPAVGWIRAGNASPDNLLLELNELRKKNDRLNSDIAGMESRLIPENENLAGLDETFEVTLEWRCKDSYGILRRHTKTVEISWGDMFARVAPDLVTYPDDSSVNNKLGSSIYRIARPGSNQKATLLHEDFQTVRTQLQALDLIKTDYTKTTKGGMALFWSLTNRGERLMVQMRTIKAGSQDPKGREP
ncbi:MAG: DUF4062 domain-containing protein [Gemmatimonadota bacterium]|nr:DUF4062 domain-containing protein [Gemmatimonadota bacterium]